MENTEAKEMLMRAELKVASASKNVTEARGCCGGWSNESKYQDAHRELYDARVANGIECTRRRSDGSYFILGS